MSSRQSAKQSPRKAAPAAVRGANTNGVVSNGSGSGGEANGGGGVDSVDSRRLKKRELDRRCQRMARERTKQRIAYLEDLVDNFRKQDSSGQIANLMKQLTDVQKERDELAKTLKSIANSIRSHEIVNGEGGRSTDEDVKDEVNSDDAPVNGVSSLPAAINFRKPSLPASDSRVLSTDDSMTEAALEGSPDEPPLVFNSNYITDANPPTDEEPILDSNLASPEVLDPDPVYPKPEQSCDCHPANHQPGQQPNLWRYACEALSYRQILPADVMKFEDAYSEDVPVRALLDGWDAVEAFYGGTLPPLWQKLRSIDEIVFHGMAIKERLACLRVMHLLYSYHSEPTPERRKLLPAWYLKRPSQAIAHSYAIDFFAWPGIRERFVFYQHRYCSNTFWHLFNSCLHILWPYEFRDCYFRNATTGQYSLSPSFEKRLFDINAWTMSDEMFKKWPEFYSDFPSYNRFPMHVTAGAGAVMKMPVAQTKALPAPEDENRRTSTSAYSRSGAATANTSGDAVISVTIAHTSAPFAPTSHPMLPLTQGITQNMPPSSSNPFTTTNEFYSVQGFDDWWGAPSQFAQQQAAAAAPQSQQQQQQNMGRGMSVIQSMVSKADQINGIYGLTF